MKLSDSNFLSKLTARKLSAVEALLDSPVADQALETAEAKVHAKRQELLTALAAVEKPHERPIAAAAKAYAAALERRIAAQAELEASLAEEARTMGASYAAQYGQSQAKALIEAELLETADPRIGRFEWILVNQDDAVRAALTIYGRPVRTGGNVGRGVAFDNNMLDVQAARAMIAECRKECDELRRAPLSYDEITARIVGMCERLERPLNDLSLNPAQIGDDGAVEAPMPWGMRRGWRVEKAIHQPRQLEPLPMAKAH